MAVQLLRTDQELSSQQGYPAHEDDLVEEPLFDGDDGQGPPSDPDEDEDLNEDEEDGKGDGPPVPPQPQ